MINSCKDKFNSVEFAANISPVVYRIYLSPIKIVGEIHWFRIPWISFCNICFIPRELICIEIAFIIIGICKLLLYAVYGRAITIWIKSALTMQVRKLQIFPINT